MVRLHPQLHPQHLSNYSISCRPQKPHTKRTLARVCSDFLLYKCLIYWKANKQQLQNDLSSGFQGLSETVCQTDFEHFLTHTAEPTASSKWLGSMLGRTKKPFILTKAFFLLHPRPRCAAGGTPHVFRLQLTLPTAMETLSWHNDVNAELINFHMCSRGVGVFAPKAVNTTQTEEWILKLHCNVNLYHLSGVVGVQH